MEGLAGLLEEVAVRSSLQGIPGHLPGILAIVLGMNPAFSSSPSITWLLILVKEMKVTSKIA